MTIIKKSPTDVPRAPGTWKELLCPDRVSATITCPHCGAYGSIDEHFISNIGEVTPSVICPNECGFHDVVVLEGWLGINGSHLTKVM